METNSFIPVLSDLYLTMAGCAAGIGVMTFLAVRAGRTRTRDPRKKVLLPMLAYFAGLLFLMALLGAFWTAFKYPEVRITANRMEIDGETYPIPAPGSIRLEQVGAGLNRDETVLLMQTRDRRNWAFPASRYDVQEMYRQLRAAAIR